MCKKSVYKYVDDWTKLTKRIGYWIDTKNPYETMDNNYIESEWWILKQIYKKKAGFTKIIKLFHTVLDVNSLSTHELAQGYKDDVDDPSIYVKFKVKDEANTYFLAWTTTPWTLTGNVALAVDAKQNYVKVKVQNEYLVLAEKE